MKQPHKHAELIKAWADGATIEWFDGSNWGATKYPTWEKDAIYRIKPEPKPDIGLNCAIAIDDYGWAYVDNRLDENLRLIFDGETRKLKKAEVLE